MFSHTLSLSLSLTLSHSLTLLPRHTAISLSQFFPSSFPIVLILFYATLIVQCSCFISFIYFMRWCRRTVWGPIIRRHHLLQRRSKQKRKRYKKVLINNHAPQKYILYSFTLLRHSPPHTATLTHSQSSILTESRNQQTQSGHSTYIPQHSQMGNGCSLLLECNLFFVGPVERSWKSTGSVSVASNSSKSSSDVR